MRAKGVLMMLGSALSNQVGAATGALAFPALGPAGVVAVRQWVAAILLVGITRPRFRTFTRREWEPVLALAAVYAIMNLTLYTAIDRIGLGLAVTLEFLGPLAVALAASRRRLDLYCALAAGAAVVVLMRPQPTTDYFGIALGLVAAACWACYILLNRTLGNRLPSAQGAAAASTVSAIVYLPIGVLMLLHHKPTLQYVAYAVVAGVLSSAVPFLVDLIALRRVPTGFYGLFMSVNPLLAVLVGWAVLHQTLGPIEWLAVATIITANTVAAAVPVSRPAAHPAGATRARDVLGAESAEQVG
ncbi:EamA family transporter [Kribbella sp. CA-293567]|uniref:EamA family transporter n=1 Tax=Kribbella sp. CA-293567 TaxID=3002436 RepID=UPI0022DE6F2F|nr:EamA family transporter [Kribbella sp. CA-293567]WBQ04501.1 EamA family transporter [Kribbella sp. CA-293567]